MTESFLLEYSRMVGTLKSRDYEGVKERLSTEFSMDLLHSIVGISGESGELENALKKHIFYGTELDIENIKEELGDLLWYIQLACSTLGVSVEKILKDNMEKLRKRYPEKTFTKEHASARLDKNPERHHGAAVVVGGGSSYSIDYSKLEEEED